MTKVNRLPVLVTGGAGYIGSHAVLALRDAGWPVTVIDNLSTGFRFALPDGVPFYEGDIADAQLLARIFAEQGTGAIMHFAGSIVVPESVTDPLKYYLNNTVRTRALIAAAVEAGVPHFIFSSTAATYGMPTVAAVTEDTPQQPINPYGWSKLMSERMLADVSAAHPMNHCALRYFAGGADRRASPVDDDELRLWPGFFGSRGSRRGRSRHQSHDRAAHRAAPIGRFRYAHFRSVVDQGDTALAAAPCRS